ncbi:MAG: TVP38/TMEM64 family protein [Kiloniellales bacterium]
MTSERTESSTPKGHPRSRAIGRLLPAAVLLTGLILFFALGLDHYFSFEILQEHRGWLMGQIEELGPLAILLYILLYATVTAFSIPLGAALTIVAGFFFGTAVAAACGVVGGTLGAAAVFLAARTAVGDLLRAKAGPALKRMEAGFRENAFSYLLVLRLIPIFPFWLVNLVPAFLGVTLRTYVVATFVGVIPGALVYASLGSGLGALLDSGEQPDLSVIFEPEILIPIVLLAVLALLPVVYKKVKARQSARD